MSYSQHTWTSGELVTAAKLNNIEAGLNEAYSDASSVKTKADKTLTYDSSYSALKYETDDVNKIHLRLTSAGVAEVVKDVDGTWQTPDVLIKKSDLAGLFKVVNGTVSLTVAAYDRGTAKVAVTVPSGYTMASIVSISKSGTGYYALDITEFSIARSTGTVNVQLHNTTDGSITVDVTAHVLCVPTDYITT